MALEQDGVSNFALFPKKKKGSLAMLIFLCSSAILIALFVEVVVSDGDRFVALRIFFIASHVCDSTICTSDVDRFVAL